MIWRLFLRGLTEGDTYLKCGGTFSWVRGLGWIFFKKTDWESHLSISSLSASCRRDQLCDQLLCPPAASARVALAISVFATMMGWVLRLRVKITLSSFLKLFCWVFCDSNEKSKQCIHTHILRYMCTYLQAYVHTCFYTYIHAYMCILTCIHTYLHKHISW